MLVEIFQNTVLITSPRNSGGVCMDRAREQSLFSFLSDFGGHFHPILGKQQVFSNSWKKDRRLSLPSWKSVSCSPLLLRDNLLTQSTFHDLALAYLSCFIYQLSPFSICCGHAETFLPLNLQCSLCTTCGISLPLFCVSHLCPYLLSVLNSEPLEDSSCSLNLCPPMVLVQ